MRNILTPSFFISRGFIPFTHSFSHLIAVSLECCGLCYRWMVHARGDFTNTSHTVSEFIHTGLCEDIVKTLSKHSSSSLSLWWLQHCNFSVLWPRWPKHTVITLGCQEVGQNETFIAPQRAHYLSRRKGKCYPSPKPFCFHSFLSLSLSSVPY